MWIFLENRSDGQDVEPFGKNIPLFAYKSGTNILSFDVESDYLSC